MYATCLFCNAALGANEAIEHFPVGRRLAYDSATGRLWVVCKTCERWNLSPLETRWEAMEEAERLFRGTKMRASTDNIGLARLKEGTELVRIGKPLKTEFAAWRYGDQFEKRHRKTWVFAGGSLLLSVGSLGMVFSLPFIVSGSGVFGAAIGASMLVNAANTTGGVMQAWKARRKISATVRDANGELLQLTQMNVREATLFPTGHTFDWKLRLRRNRIVRAGPVSRLFGSQEELRAADEDVFLTGDVAARALATMLPHVNSTGASKRAVRDALTVIDDAPNVQYLLHKASISQSDYRRENHMDGGESALGELPHALSLALEMSLHSDDERRAMEGELKELEQRWRDAAAIAKISDELLVPEQVAERLQAMHGAGERDAKARDTERRDVETHDEQSHDADAHDPATRTNNATRRSE